MSDNQGVPATQMESVANANSAQQLNQRPKTLFAGKRCFVIMPYGVKSISLGGGETKINFEDVYNKIIEPAVMELNMDCIRIDKVSRSGLIHREMIENIIESDAVVVDITLLNPNVFYELGIRHTARQSGTVIIRLADHPIPFNINGLRVFDYKMSSEEELIEARNMLSTNVANSLADQAVDSLVYTLTGSSMSIRRIGRPIPWREAILYKHRGLGRHRIGIVTGDICQVDFVDVWVNPENTRMQMGRMHDEFISACVRYLGGKKDIQKMVVGDLIANELKQKIGVGGHVEAGHVVATSAGGLTETHRVRLIFHAAAMHGEPTKGYQLIRNFPSCVTMALHEMDRFNSMIFSGLKPNKYRGKLHSILFPLFGTRDGRLEPRK